MQLAWVDFGALWRRCCFRVVCLTCDLFFNHCCQITRGCHYEYYSCIILGYGYLSRRCREFTNKVVRFNPARLSLVGFPKIAGPCHKKLQSADALEANITQAIAEIQPDLCDRGIENWTVRIRATTESRSEYLSVVVFHT